MLLEKDALGSNVCVATTELESGTKNDDEKSTLVGDSDGDNV
jgi:hypothetical protein